MEITNEVARALHKIARCIHDRVCPKCGSCEFRKKADQSMYQCSGLDCGYKVSCNLVERALLASVPSQLSDALTIFEEWRFDIS